LRQFDPRYLEDMSAGDNEFVREIICTFVETACDLIDGIVQAAAESNVEKAVYVAHTLKGSSRSVGAAPLGDVCEELERLAKSGDMESFKTVAAAAKEVYALLTSELALFLQPKAA
jgi:two-component system sensor histidine kinase EvgS